MAQVIQASNNPTNKLTAAIVAAATMEVFKAVFTIQFPEFDQPELWASLTPVAVWAAGYFIKDDVNVQVTVEK